jgi:tetratricopeptide (TPR) repeat protein
MAAQLTPRQLVEVVQGERRERWQKGERVLAETYLQRYPALQTDPECVLEVVYHEVLLREELGEAPQQEEYMQRFPQLTPHLKPLFVVHRALEAGQLGDVSSVETSRHAGLSRTGNAVSAELPTVPGYKILGVLGRGGMGVVFKAVQERLKRVVALKMILAGIHADTRELDRFRAEAEAQARLQHPHIVQIYEVGEAEGRPYLAVEYVDGGNLAGKLDGTPRLPREAAHLVETLARAVHAAHQQNIIHRDLKPANVLLTADGQPKITDFGLAKRLDQQTGQTHSGAIVGTPSYMAPEQAEQKNQKIGPAVDVYALGAILYELLTGRPPFKAATVLETVDLVRSAEPVPPSRLQLKGPRDVETICLKCLQKEPGKRYASAEALADDLRRFQHGESIRARPVPLWEQGLKWAKRRPAAASLLGVCLAAAVGLAVGTGLLLAANERLRAANTAERQARQEADQKRAEADQQKERADANYHQSEENLRGAYDALHTLSAVTENELRSKSGMQPLRQRLSRKVLECFQRLLRQQRNDPEIQFDLALAYHHLGIVIRDIGKLDDALTTQQSVQALLQRLYQQRPDQTRTRANLGAAHFYIGLLQYALGQMDEALHAYQQALAIQKQLVEENPSYPWYQRNVAASNLYIGNVYLTLSQPGEAHRYYEQARVIEERLVREKPKDQFFARFVEQLALNDYYMGLLHNLIGQPSSALRFLNQARARQERLLSEKPGEIWWQLYLAKTDLSLGIVHDNLGQRDEAVRFFNQARAPLEQLVRENSCVTEFQRTLAEVSLNIGNLQREKGQYAEAFDRLEKARAICQQLLQDNPAVTQSQVILADSYTGIGLAQRAQGQSAKALRSLRDSQRVWEKLVHAHPDVPRFRSGLAGVYHELGSLQRTGKQRTEALHSYEQARSMQEALVRECPDIPDYQRALSRTLQDLELTKREGK